MVCFKFAIQAEMDMENDPFGKVIKQMFSMCRYVLNRTAINSPGVFGEPALWRGKKKSFTAKEFAVVACNSVYRVSFWHVDVRELEVFVACPLIGTNLPYYRVHGDG